MLHAVRHSSTCHLLLTITAAAVLQSIRRFAVCADHFTVSCVVHAHVCLLLQCCLPAGVDIVLHQDLAVTNAVPHTFAVVLTGGSQQLLPPTAATATQMAAAVYDALSSAHACTPPSSNSTIEAGGKASARQSRTQQQQLHCRSRTPLVAPATPPHADDSAVMRMHVSCRGRWHQGICQLPVVLR